MPIATTLIRPRVAEAGKIKIGWLGEERTSKGGRKFRLPTKLSSFMITKTIRGKEGTFVVDGPLMDAVAKSDGWDGQGAPTIGRIPILLHSDDIDAVFQTSLALYTKTSCACRGDGEVATRLEVVDDTPLGKVDVCATQGCPFWKHTDRKKPLCKPNGRLICTINVPGASVAGAVHILRTTSQITISQIMGSLQQIRSIMGTIRGIPLWLVVTPTDVSPEGKKTRVYVCHIELCEEDVMQLKTRVLQERSMEAQLGLPPVPLMIDVPDIGGEVPDEQEVVQQEYYPEDEQQESAEPAKDEQPEQATLLDDLMEAEV